MTETPAPATESNLDPDVARWLERAEALVGLELYGRAAAVPDNPSGAAVQEIADGIAAALTSIDIGFFNRSMGLGVDHPITEPDIEAVSRFYHQHARTQSVIQLAPSVITPDVEAWMTARGYGPSRWWVKLWHDLGELPTPSTALRIERIDAGLADTFVRIVTEVFEFPDETDALARAAVGQPGWSHYLGFDRDTPVSVAAMYVAEGVAWLGFGATLEVARGRGGQSAMFARRLADARDLGCRFAVTETGKETEEDPVNHSYRNMLRSGFRLAYARRNWVRVTEPG